MKLKHIKKEHERRGYKRGANGKLEKDPGGKPIPHEVAAIKCDPTNEEVWNEIYQHAKSEGAPKGETIGLVLVQLTKAGSPKGRWIVYAKASENSDIVSSPGIQSNDSDDVTKEDISFYYVESDVKALGYVHIACNKVCYFEGESIPA